MIEDGGYRVLYGPDAINEIKRQGLWWTAQKITENRRRGYTGDGDWVFLCATDDFVAIHSPHAFDLQDLLQQVDDRFGVARVMKELAK